MRQKKRIAVLLICLLLGWSFQAQAAPQTGWRQAGSSWYYLNRGARLTGWQQISGRWYYLGGDGVMKSGWQKIGGSWYYLGNAGDGSMKSGWQKLGGSWYYLGGENDGAMKSGWQHIKGIWYYLGGADDGAMKSGWQHIGGAWYYLGAGEDGAMREECWVDQYYVGENGAWIPGYLETKEVKKASISWRHGNGEHAQKVLETQEQAAIRRITEYVGELRPVQVNQLSPAMGSSQMIRLDYADGTYQRYLFSYRDEQGQSVVRSNGKYFHYREEDLKQLWSSLGGEEIEE